MAVWEIKKNGSWLTMPSPAHGGMKVGEEPVWSSNTGRGATGKMSGDIVAWKKTLDMEFAALSFSDATLIRDTLRTAGEFFEVRYKDTTQSWEYATVYTAGIPHSVYSFADGVTKMVTGMTVSLVEQ